MHLRHQIQDLIDNKLVQFDNMARPNVITNPLRPHQERNVNAISTVEERIPNFSFPWKATLQALAYKSHIVLENIRAPRFDWEVYLFCDNGDQHALFDCRVLKAQVQSLANHGIIWIEKEVVQRNDCMVVILCPLSTLAGTSHNAMSIASRKD